MRTILALIFSFVFGQQLLAIEEISNAKPEYITEFYQKALAKYNKGDYEGSLNDIRHVIKSNMKDYRLRYLAGHNHWRNKNYTSAIIHLQTAMSVKPLEASAYIDLGLIFLEQKNFYRALSLSQGAIRKLEANQKQIPSKLYNIAARANLTAGSSRTALEMAQKAKAVFEKAPKAEQNIKDKIEAIILEARAHLALGSYEKADLSLQWALGYEKKMKLNPYTFNLMGYVHEQWSYAAPAASKKEHHDQATRYYQMAIDNGSGSIKILAQANLKRISK